jgi:hypothetical protein
MEIVVAAYRLSTTSLKDINDDNNNSFFILKNCLNSVLEALKSSTVHIIE